MEKSFHQKWIFSAGCDTGKRPRVTLGTLRLRIPPATLLCVKMATGCCGVKRQKVSAPPEKDRADYRNSNSSNHDYRSCSSGHSSNECNGYLRPRLNGVEKGLVVCAEMCYFCFDILHRHLHNIEPAHPGPPKFTDAALWVITMSRLYITKYMCVVICVPPKYVFIFQLWSLKLI